MVPAPWSARCCLSAGRCGAPMRPSHFGARGAGASIACGLLVFGLLGRLASAQSNYATPYLVTTISGTNSAGRADGAPAQARFSSPGGVAAYGPDVVYVADSNNHTIRKITVGQGVTTLAGEPGVSGFRNGVGGAARFSTPNGVAVDKNGNVYVADTNNHVIRKIT